MSQRAMRLTKLSNEHVRIPFQGILNENISYVAYALALITWLMFNVLYTSFFAVRLDSVTRYIHIFCIVILVLSELTNNKVSGRSIIGLAIVLILIYAVRQSTYSSLSYSLLFLYEARNHSFKRIAKLSLIVISITVLFVIVSAYTGLILNYVEHGTRHRVFMGFRYSLYPARYMFEITGLLIYIKGRDFSIPWCAVILIFNTVVFFETDSRLSYYLSVVMIFVAFICARNSSRLKSKSIGYMLSSVFIFASIVSLVLIINYNPSSHIYYLLDNFLGHRLSYGKQAFDIYGVNILGQPVSFVGNGLDIYGLRNVSGEYFYVDCLYMRSLIQLGLLFLVFYVIAYTALTYRSWKNGEVFLCLVLAFLALHGMIDDLSLSLHYNVFFIAISVLFSDSDYLFNSDIKHLSREIY